MLIEHLCPTCKNREHCPIAERFEVFTDPDWDLESRYEERFELYE